jgi:hypothetical protein
VAPVAAPEHGRRLGAHVLRDERPLEYIDTLAGELFLESPTDISRLTTVFDHIKTLAISPAESTKFVRKMTV